MIRPELLTVLLIAAPVLADPPRPAVVNAVADVYRPFPLDQQKLGGIIGARLRANSEGYVEHVDSMPTGAAEDQSGTRLDAAAYAFEYGRDPTINTVMVRLAKKLMASQAPDGYFGARPSPEQSPEQTPEQNPGQWDERDTWIQSADLLGILNYYSVSGDPAALSASTKLGNLLVKERQKQSGRGEGIVFGAALESMASLFRYTDNHKYLEFCNSVAEAWLHAKPPQLGVTYKNLAILNGLVELYRITGEESFYAAPLKAWTEMHASGFALTGIPADDSNENPGVLSACTTSAWLQLSANLLRIGGQAVYGEQLERTVYNQLFAGQDAKTGTVFAPVSSSGGKQAANNGPCAANEVRALTTLPSLVWGRYGNGIAVNLYTDGRATVRLRRRGVIQLYTETNYPESGNVLLHIEPDHPIHFPLRLRVPDWTSKFTADVGEDHFVGKPGEFLILNRGWKRGDTVKISMVMTARAIPGIRQFSADVAIARGPQILALAKALNPDMTDLNTVKVERVTSAELQLTPLPTGYAANWMSEQAYALPGTYQGQKKRLVLVPFADAMSYRVWLAQSKASTGASAR